MNVADTEVVFAILGKEGYSRTDDPAQADVILVNTCSVRDNAEQRIRGRLEQFNVWRKARPGVLVGVLGCMAERLKESLLESGKVDVVRDTVAAVTRAKRVVNDIQNAEQPNRKRNNAIKQHNIPRELASKEHDHGGDPARRSNCNCARVDVQDVPNNAGENNRTEIEYQKLFPTVKPFKRRSEKEKREHIAENVHKPGRVVHKSVCETAVPLRRLIRDRTGKAHISRQRAARTVI